MNRECRLRPILKCSASSLLVSACWLFLLATASVSGQTIPESVKASHRTLYPDYHPGVNIVRETQAGKDVNIGSGSFQPLYAEESRPAGPEPSYPDHELHALACDADAVVVASPKSAETDLTEAGDFLYTDYFFRTEAVLKSPSSSLGATSEIIVTRPGGETKLNGHNVKTEAFSFPLFQIGGRYLLFLRYLPESKTYMAFRSGTFIVPPNGVPTPIDSSQRLNTKSARREDTFLTEVRAAATAPCDPRLTPRLY